MSQSNTFTSSEYSTINVLVRWSGIDPISLENLEKHFRKVDPTSWKIISTGFIQSSREKIEEILLQVMQTPGIQYNIKSLVEMLLTLPNVESLKDKLIIN